jgi:hypothetical protein
MTSLTIRHGWVLGFVLLAGACGKDTPVSPAPDCRVVTVSPDSFTFEPGGGTGTVGLTIAAGCQWTASSDANWIAFAGAANGSGPGAIPFTVAANAATAERTATIAVAGRTIPVRQHASPAAPDCTYVVDPDMASYPHDGGSGSISVTSTDMCPWTAESQVSWITIDRTGGTGSGSVGYTIQANDGPAERTGTIDIAGHVVTIVEAGNVVAACTYSISPVTFTPCVNSVELSATLTTQASCPWTASPGASWITMLSGTSGAGPGLVRFSVADNFDAPRSGVVMVRWPTPTAGQNLQVAQAGCHYAVTQKQFTIPPAGGAFTFDVLQETDPNTCGGPLQDACVWSAVSNADWVVVPAGTHRGDDRVSFTVSQNATGAPRASTIVVRDQVVQITQN